jgi:TolB-like protein
MRAHAARGERGMAIQAYERCRAVLADLLDTSPSAETQKLLAEIRGPNPRLQPRRPPPPPEMPDAPEEADPAPVRDHAAPAAAAEEPARARREARGMRGGARIGIAPFQMVGTGPEDAHLAPGLAGEITTALSRFRWMFVVLLGSLDRLPADQRNERGIRQNFAIDFLVDGTVQRVGTRLRVTIRLVDLRNNNQIVWARRFDRQAHDLLTLQDEIAAEVVAQIDPEVLLIEANRVATQPLVDATAYDLVLRALPLIWRMDREPYMDAGTYLARAVELEPEYAAAQAWYAVWHVFYIGQGWASEPVQALERAGQLAERAVALDPQDARGLTIAGHVRAFLHRRPREALALHDRALHLNPNLAMAWNLSGVAHAYLGNLEEAEIRINRYKRLSPLDPHAFFFDTAFIILGLLKRDYESAVVAGRAVSEMNPSFSAACKPYLAALGHLNYRQEAAVVRRRLFSIEPNFSIRQFIRSTPIDRMEDREHYVHGLRLAGVPEESGGATPD